MDCFNNDGLCNPFSSSSMCYPCPYEKLFNNKFIRLPLFLSISDACMLIEYIWHSAVMTGNDFSNNFQHQCFVLKFLLGATINFSALQMFLICLERLTSTFAVPFKFFRVITWNVCVLVCLAVTNGIALVLAACDIFQKRQEEEPNGCSADFSLQGYFMLSFDVPLIICVLCS